MYLIVDDNPDQEIKYFVCQKLDGKIMQKCVEVTSNNLTSIQAKAIVSNVVNVIPTMSFTGTMNSILFVDER